MPYGKQRTGRTPVKKRKSAAKAPTGRSGLKGGLMGKAGKGMPAKQMSKKKKKATPAKKKKSRIKTPITMHGLEMQIENKKRLKRLKKSI